MWKFRSMRVAKGANEASLRPDQDRIFWWGKWMRRLKIDELPQLINILNGTMSIVGPRPAAVDQVEITRGGENAIAATVPCGLTSQSSLWDYVYGDQFPEEKEYNEKVLPIRLKLDGYEVISGPRTTGDGYYESCIIGIEGNQIEITVKTNPSLSSWKI